MHARHRQPPLHVVASEWPLQLTFSRLAGAAGARAGWGLAPGQQEKTGGSKQSEALQHGTRKLLLVTHTQTESRRTLLVKLITLE